MAVTAPPTLTDAPASPDRSDRTTFSARAVTLDDFTKNTQIPQLRTALANVFSNATEASAQASIAAAQVTLAAAQVTLAAAQVTAATAQAVAAASSAAAAGATAFVSGSTSAVGDARYSLINFLTYRARTVGVKTVDPSSDSVGWAPNYPPDPPNIANFLNYK